MRRPGLIVLAWVLTVSIWATSLPHARRVMVPVWIEGGSGRMAPRFHATVNGKPAPLTGALGPSSDQIVLVVLDLTANLSLIETAKQALISQISRLPQNTWVGLLRDQDGLHVLADPSANRKPVLAAIQSLSNSGQPGVLETVTSALSLANAIIHKSAVRAAVLYVTDGSIYSYREDYTNPVINQSDPYDLSRAFPDALIDNKITTLTSDLRSLEAPLFVVQLEYRRDELSEAYQNGLQALAGGTGGDSDICQSQAEIPDAIAAILKRISETWLVTLALPPKSANDLRIHLSASGRKGSFRLFWRAHLRLTEG